tara:strand:+ start:97 stop:1458 length:1362 start_codon:yes stop_codon:yes gene_type:complete
MQVQGSKYEKFKIISANGRNSVELGNDEYKEYGAPFRITNIFFYENILSPYITGVIIIQSTLDAASDQSDTQGRRGSLHSALPLEVGCKVLLKIQDPLGKGIDYSDEKDPFKQLYVDEVQMISKTSSMETVQLRVVSKIGWTNNTKRVTACYKNRISESVKGIVKNELKMPSDMIEVDESSNSYSFAGMTKRPFDLIAMLAKQTIPTNTANPGYFAYETRSGFHFVSADSIINKEPYEKKYWYAGGGKDEINSEESDYEIATLTTQQDQNLSSQIRSGVYANKTIFFNPASYQFTEIDITVEDGKLYKDPKFSTLGKTPETPSILSEDFQEGSKFHRVQTAVLNIGAEKENIDVNNSPELYYAAGSTRYNILFSQRHTITIPANTDLEAGDTLTLEIEKVSENKEQGPDQKTSGNYIIQALCHYFEPEKSVTSINLIRDSYGLHFAKNTKKKK